MLNPKLVEVIQKEIEQARSEGLSEEDVSLMACGAALRYAREQGVVGEEASDEIMAAIFTVVKQAMQRKD